jgi:primosomal protein N' (replication factor Y) (superfamily II helicase)
VELRRLHLSDDPGLNMNAATIVRVALDVPLPKLFDYRAEGATRDDVGARVLVPFGKKRQVGVIVEVAAGSDLAPERLRRVERILRDATRLPAEWLAFAQFASDYYHEPLGGVVMSALPPRLRGAKPAPGAPRAFALTAAGRDALAVMPARHVRQRALLERLAAVPVDAAQLAAAERAQLARALASGWIEAAEPGREVARFVAAHELNAEQAEAVAAVPARGFGVTVLFGVTGSGKTEVYLRWIARTLSEGKQALVLVPEIALTPALERAFRERFPGARLVVQTSAMAGLERASAWLAALQGRADVVLGTRLAVFAPLARLGLVVVDEEQDASFKQQEGLRYSARDLAIVRARSAGAPVVLVSATPSVETFHHALSGRYRMIELHRRAVPEAEMPTIRLVDLREHAAREGLAAPLLEAIGRRLERGEQSLVFLNRRGYAPVLACPACGWVSGCTRCSAHLVLHLADRQLRCHHCGLAEGVPRACPQCGNPDLRPFGRGTQRIEATLAERFPKARVLRIDRDAARGRAGLEGLLDRAQRREADILVGTQIMAKGHHLGRLTLVGVVNADAGLFSPDYRAGERTFAQLQQVAGRAGRAELPGEVLIQTRYPHHPLYRSLVRHDFAGFAKTVLAEREKAGFPPFVFEAALRAESRDAERAIGFLQRAAGLAPSSEGAVTLFDPAPMSLARLGGMERAQMLAQSASRPRLQAFLREWTGRLYAERAPGVRWHLDVDPTEF